MNSVAFKMILVIIVVSGFSFFISELGLTVFEDFFLENSLNRLILSFIFTAIPVIFFWLSIGVLYIFGIIKKVEV